MPDLDTRPFEAAVLAELSQALEDALGLPAASIRTAELRALAEANPAIAPSFLVEELRRWRNCAAAVHSARLPHVRGAGHV
jgi:hypothetical protein